MIQETKKFSIADLAKVTSQLCFAYNYHKEQSTYYLTLFNKEAVCEPGSMLPNSPLAELYQRLCEFHTKAFMNVYMYMERLQGIADSTMLPDLDY